MRVEQGAGSLGSTHMRGTIRLLVLVCLNFCLNAVARAAPASVDMAGYDPRCGVDVRSEGLTLRAAWAAGETKLATVLDISGELPLVQSLSVSEGAGELGELA